MSYRNLVDVALTVDNSELEEHLGRIDQNVEVLTDRVKSIEDGGYPVDEDKVQEIVSTMGYVEADDFSTRLEDNSDAIEQVVRDLMHSEGEDFVQSVIDSGDYITGDDADQRVRDAIENGDFANPAQVDEKIEEALENSNFASASTVEDLGERVDALEGEDNASIVNAQAQIRDLERANEILTREQLSGAAALVDTNERIDDLFDKLKYQGERSDSIEQTILALMDKNAALEAKAARAERIFDKLNDLVQALLEEQKGS